jgi:hypothetical protein
LDRSPNRPWRVLDEPGYDKENGLDSRFTV